MSDDLEGKLHDLEKCEDDEEDEKEGEDEEELDRQMGEVDEKETEKLDEQMWGSDDEEEGSDNEVRVEVFVDSFNPLPNRDAFWRLWKIMNVYENIMENGSFALLEQMLYFP